MLLTSPEFFYFLVFIFIDYWLFWKQKFAAVLFICPANLFFDAKWGWIYLALLPIASACDFFIGNVLTKSPHPTIRRVLVTASLLLNIGLIVVCRYVPFLTQGGWILPLSLSFYAFQALTYTIDIYLGDAEPAKSYWTYLASVNFFPTVLCRSDYPSS